MENINFWLQAIISLLSGLLALIPLTLKLVQYVKAAVKEKNWTNMLKLVMGLMAQAEVNFEDGAERKQWVLSELRSMADTLNYEVDYIVVSEMIDALCDMAGKVNINEGVE